MYHWEGNFLGHGYDTGLAGQLFSSNNSFLAVLRKITPLFRFEHGEWFEVGEIYSGFSVIGLNLD